MAKSMDALEESLPEEFDAAVLDATMAWDGYVAAIRDADRRWEAGAEIAGARVDSYLLLLLARYEAALARLVALV
jgi:hypothetical protein